MPAEDMNRRKETVVTVAKKIVDNINAMSFLNLDDHQVHSLMMMREIARGVVNSKVSKVTKSDVKKALSFSIEKMVGSCKDVSSILSRIPCEGMDDEQTHSVSRMKEIVSTIVSRRSKILGIRNRELLESGDGFNAETVESKMAGARITTNDNVEIGGIQRRLFEDKAEPVMAIEGGQSEGMDIIMAEAVHSGNGNFLVGGEHDLVVVDEAMNVCNEIQVATTEGLMFEDVELMVEVDERIEDGQDEKQETVNGTLEQISEGGQNEVRKLTLVSPFRLTIVWPRDGKLTLDWVKDMMAKLDQSSKKDPPSEFSSLMSSDVVEKLISAASSVLSKEPNCVEVDCQGEDSRVIVVGDVEGHFHDLLNIFALAGFPSDNQFYVFNGNYVDRGAWGLEVFLVLLAWKVLMPNRVYLLRGNHETRLCTTVYGFEQEVKTKFGDQGEMVYQKCLECFKELPLASVISKTVYTTHGGLFRSIGHVRRSKRKRSQFLDLGSLEDLPKVKRNVVDASDGGPTMLADILWSDPSKEDGLVENADKRLGLTWGPDCTEAFLKESKLKLIIRSHQGPDSRAGQDDFGDLLNGYSEDHVVESGKLYTLFSAPDYPQFGEPKYNNEGAYAVLKAPNFENPSFHSFKGVRRPQLAAYGSSSSETSYPAWMSLKIDFEALGISNLPSWSVQLPDGSGGTKAVEVPRASSVEGMPLPSDLQEPHRAAFEYLFELVAGLKHMISSRVIESEAPESAVEGDVPNESEVQNIPNERVGESLPDEKEAEDVPNEIQGQDVSDVMEVDEKEVQGVPNENEEKNVPNEIKEKNGPEEMEVQTVSDEKEGENNASSEPEKQSVSDEKEGQNASYEKGGENASCELGKQNIPVENEGQIISVEKGGENASSEPEKQNISDEKEGQNLSNEKEGENVRDDEKEGEENIAGVTEAELIPGENEGADGPNEKEAPSEKEAQNISGEKEDKKEEHNEEETVSKEKEEPKIPNEDRNKDGEQKVEDESKGKGKSEPNIKEEKTAADENKGKKDENVADENEVKRRG